MRSIRYEKDPAFSPGTPVPPYIETRGRRIRHVYQARHVLLRTLTRLAPKVIKRIVSTVALDDRTAPFPSLPARHASHALVPPPRSLRIHAAARSPPRCRRPSAVRLVVRAWTPSAAARQAFPARCVVLRLGSEHRLLCMN
jgi:hypothetical protein